MSRRGLVGMPTVLVVAMAMWTGTKFFAAPQERANTAAAASSGYRIRAVPLADVEITDRFWSPRLQTNERVTIPHILTQNEQTGRVANFARAAGKAAGKYEGRRFNDTDVYKIIEAASYSLVHHPDPALDKQLDDLIALIAAAQEPDGYLFPARTIDPKNPAPGVGTERWMYENGSHELYNSGHLYEAAVAHFQATGKRTLLDVAVKNANLVRKDFGPTARKVAPGHEEIELALFRLAAATNGPQYADLAKFFVDRRGLPSDTTPYPPGPFAMYNGLDYKQDHRPAVEQDKAVGHAVRGVYLYAGMTDVAATFRDMAYTQAVDRLWQDVVSKRMYVTGGIGSRGGVEAFGDDYELPNARAYTETCAAIGYEQWNHRLFRLHGDAKYLDVAEQILYNGLLSGVSIEGNTFFYQNPLESDGRRERSAYFDVACCPANLARTLAQLPGLIYATQSGGDGGARGADALFVGFFIGSRAKTTIAGQPVQVSQETNYPWDGAVSIRIDPEKPVEFALNVRIPGWSRNTLIASDLYRFATDDAAMPTLTVNGKPDTAALTTDSLARNKGFARVRRTWKKGDVVQLTLPMPTRRVLAHDGVEDDRGKAAIQRGPLVYSVEGVDHEGRVKNLRLPLDARLTPTFKADLLGGVTVITGEAESIGADGQRATRTLTAIPYYAWANRGKGEMLVWIPHSSSPPSGQ